MWEHLFITVPPPLTPNKWSTSKGLIRINVSQPHSLRTLPLHPPGGGGISEGGRSGMERRCWGISCSASASSVSSLEERSLQKQINEQLDSKWTRTLTRHANHVGTSLKQKKGMRVPFAAEGSSPLLPFREPFVYTSPKHPSVLSVLFLPSFL